MCSRVPDRVTSMHSGLSSTMPFHLNALHSLLVLPAALLQVIERDEILGGCINP